jgi:beta-glucanase (GH16 family)
MKALPHAVLLFACAGLTGCATTPGAGSPPGTGLLPPESGWKLVWSDEFEKPGRPDPDKWAVLEWLPFTLNNESQAYVDTPETSRVENGRLIIQARRGAEGDYPYQSARLTSEGLASFLYGRFEFRAKLPTGRGTWPALWMMPEDLYAYGRGWPDSGEIDVMEHVGFDPGVVQATIHTGAYNWPAGTQRFGKTTLADAFKTWHTYAVEWAADGMDFFVDDEKIFTFPNEGHWKAWPYDKPFHMILNLAVGGNWGGQQGIDDSLFPATLEVDWVRVYQKAP